MKAEVLFGVHQPPEIAEVTVDKPQARFASLFSRGMLDLNSLVSERIAPAEINRSFETMIEARLARSVITFSDVLSDAAASA